MKPSKIWLIPLFVVAGLVACTFTGGSPVVAVQDSPGVVPVPDDSIQPLSQLDRIEGKLDKVLSNTEKTVEQLEGLKESNNANALMIVEAIKGLKSGDAVCPDCPTEPPKPEVTNSKVVVKYRSVKSPRWRINGKVWTRGSIISHLMTHPNHRGQFDRETLDAMTIGQLWAAHDDHHDAMTLDVVPVPGDPVFDPSPGDGGCPGGICPGNRVRLFPRLRCLWRR